MSTEACRAAEILEFDPSAWAEEQRENRLARNERLVNPPEWSDFWIKRQLLEHALVPMCDTLEESRGSNMEVWLFDESKLKNLFENWVEECPEVDQAGIRAKITNAATYISKRYVFKVGNVKDHPVKFGDRVRILPKDYVHELAGPIGYLGLNGDARAEMLAGQVVGINHFIGNEETVPITEVSLYRAIYFLFNKGDASSFVGPPLFIERDDDPNYGMNVVQIHNQRADVHALPRAVRDYDDYRAFNKQMRAFDPQEFRPELEPFFEAFKTIGIHDSIRNLFGEAVFGRNITHTSLSYTQAIGLIEHCFKEHGSDSFLVSEYVNVGFDPRLKSTDWEVEISANDNAAAYFSNFFADNLYDSLIGVFADDAVRDEFCYQILEHYYSVPEYDVSPATSIFSWDFLRGVANAFRLRYLKPESDRRMDFIGNPKLRQFMENLSPVQLRDLYLLLPRVFAEYYQAKTDEECKEFKRFDRTQVKVQDHLEYGGEEFEEEPFDRFSVADLWGPKKHCFREYPEIAEKLVVYYYQVYKFFRYTGYVPDARPESHLVRDVLGMGEWASRTPNVQIVIFQRKGTTDSGNRVVEIKNIDPEDHWRDMPEDPALRDPREGLAAYGLNLVAPVASRATLKALAWMLDEVAINSHVEGDKTSWTLKRKIEQFVADFIRENQVATAAAMRTAVLSFADVRRRLHDRFVEFVRVMEVDETLVDTMMEYARSVFLRTQQKS